MRIRMLKSMAGANVSYKPGDIIEVSSEIGKAWIAANIAEAAGGKPKAEKATAEVPRRRKH